MPTPSISWLKPYTDIMAKRKQNPVAIPDTGFSATKPAAVGATVGGLPPNVSVLNDMANPVKPAVDPVSGLPVQPPGTPKQTISLAPTPLPQAVESVPPKETITHRANPVAQLVDTTAPKETIRFAGFDNIPMGVETSVPSPAPAAPAPSKADGLYDSVLDEMAAGIKDNKPLPGTAAQIAQNREALATYAKSAEARAGMTAAKMGAIGQGTANQMGQAVRSDILGELAKSELGNTQLVSDEKQKLISAATQAGQFAQNKQMEQQRIDVQKDQFGQTLENQKDQFGKTFEEGKTQFAATLDQRKAEFEKNFGAAEGQAYNNQLERMAQDNPVLATKLTNHLLQGKSGPVGSFTPEEIQQMKDYTVKKQGQDDKLTAVMNKILETVPGQIEAGAKATQNAATKDEEVNAVEVATKTLNTLPQGQFLKEADFKLLSESGGLTRVTEQTIPRSSEGVQDFLRKNPTGIVSINGAQYRVESGHTARTSSGTFSNQERHTDYAKVTNSKGETKYIYDGKVQDNPPKTVSNDISPFGF